MEKYFNIVSSHARESTPLSSPPCSTLSSSPSPLPSSSLTTSHHYHQSCHCRHHHQQQIPHKTEAVCHPRLGQAPHTCLSGHPDDKEHWSTFFSQSWTKDATLVVPIFYPPLQILPSNITIQFVLSF